MNTPKTLAQNRPRNRGNSSSTVNMGYTGEGQSQRTGAGSSSYQYDINGLGAMTDSNGTIYFARTPVDEHSGSTEGDIIDQHRSNGSGYGYLVDGLGSVVAVFDDFGIVRTLYKADREQVAPEPNEYVGVRRANKAQATFEVARARRGRLGNVQATSAWSAHAGTHQIPELSVFPTTRRLEPGPLQHKAATRPVGRAAQ